MSPVHPHSRGELMSAEVTYHCQCGSPPLAWGVGPGVSLIWSDQRFTPTRVGSCRSCTTTDTRGSVHPHSRGELYIDVISYPPRSGSPPLAWGVGLAGGWALAGQRFTPTRVGSWMWINFNARCASVHPHSRGELGLERALGLEGVVHPHSRGELSVPVLEPWCASWFTPTRVGSCLPKE